tara:strand:- start:336 stop:551 length:216 start_codon:yes stop_codon:yes gene_type:complete
MILDISLYLTEIIEIIIPNDVNEMNIKKIEGKDMVRNSKKFTSLSNKKITKNINRQLCKNIRKFLKETLKR